MGKNVYLNEENYQRSKKKITKISLIVLIVGILIGGSLIAIGLVKQFSVNSKYSDDSKENLQEKIDLEKKNLEEMRARLETNRNNSLETEKKKLETKKNELESKGIEYDAFAKYDDGEVYDLYIVTRALEPKFDYCAFDEYKNNTLTSKYCSIKNNTDEDSQKISVINKALDSSFNYCAFDEYKNNTLISKYCSYKQEIAGFTDSNKKMNSFGSIPFYMFGAFVIIASCMIAGIIYLVTKQREILAFNAQQVMPIAKEGAETMAPTIGKVTKEITKGIKEGLKDDEK